MTGDVAMTDRVSTVDTIAASGRRVRAALLAVLALAVVAPVVLYFGVGPGLVLGKGAQARAQTKVQGASKGVGTQVGYTAPNFVLPALSGGRIELQQFRGQAVLMNFWATWCPPCKEEMPIMEQLYREHREKGLVVLAVSIDEPAFVNDVGPYIRRGGAQTGPFTFPVALDTQRKVAEQYRLLGLPVSYFIDRDGVIKELQIGAMNRQLMAEKLRSIVDIP
jgi:peroxiredoxin